MKSNNLINDNINNEFTLVFQGKLNNELLHMIKNNINKYNIVVVTNDDTNIDIINNINNIDNIKVIQYRYKPNENMNNKYNLFYQVYSTYLGLCNVNTKYAIKFRCDEYFENIDPLVKCIYNNKKIVVSDFLFRKLYMHVYSISDHYIGGETKILLDAFKLLYKHCLNKNNILPNCEELQHKLIENCEQYIGICILKVLYPNIKLKMNNALNCQIIDSNFEIFSSKLMGNYVFRSNGVNARLENFNYIYKYDVISTMISNDEIHRNCNIEKCDYDIIFYYHNNSIFDNKYKDIFNIINKFEDRNIILYSNDDTVISSIFKKNITIKNYNNFNINSSINILFIIDECSIDAIISKKIYCNNVFYLLITCITKLISLDFMLEYVDYIVLHNNKLNENIETFFKNRIINKDDILDYIDTKPEEIFDINDRDLITSV